MVSKEGLSNNDTQDPVIIDVSFGDLPKAIIVEDAKVIIFNVPQCQGGDKDASNAWVPDDPYRYYTDYESIYKKTVNHWPQESLRFDLLTPIPYSDAFAAPMGPNYQSTMPRETLAQINYPHSKLPYQST